MQGNPFEFMEPLFLRYVKDRREHPQDDVITKIRGHVPRRVAARAIDVVRIAVFLFAAGQGTTAHLMGNMLRHLAEQPDLQEQVRADRELVAPFVEETLRMDSPTKAVFRMARGRRRRRLSSRGGRVDHAHPRRGQPRRAPLPDPTSSRRPRERREHIAFGRGIHACPGSAGPGRDPRLNRMLDRLGDIRISEAEHGPAGERRFDWKPSFMLRGLEALHLEFTPLE